MLGCVFKAIDPMQVEERFRSEYPSDDESAANMLFVCELVNAFREGRLIEKPHPDQLDLEHDALAKVSP